MQLQRAGLAANGDSVSCGGTGSGEEGAGSYSGSWYFANVYMYDVKTGKICSGSTVAVLAFGFFSGNIY